MGMMVMVPWGEQSPGTWAKMDTAALIKLCWSGDKADPRLDLALLLACMAMTELDWAALGEMSGKYLTRTHRQTSRIAKDIDFPGLIFPVSPPSPIPATSAGMSVNDWLAGNNSFSLVFFLFARFSVADFTARLTTSRIFSCLAVLSWDSNCLWRTLHSSTSTPSSLVNCTLAHTDSSRDARAPRQLFSWEDVNSPVLGLHRASMLTPSNKVNLDLFISSGSPELVALAGPRPILALPVTSSSIFSAETFSNPPPLLSQIEAAFSMGAQVVL